MDVWLKEIIEQICVGITLKESKIDSGNRLALIAIDNGVEFGLKFYASYHTLLKRKDLGDNGAFFKVLGLIEGKKISSDLSKRIKQYHNTRNDLYHGAKLTTVGDKVVDAYVKDAKELFRLIFNFQMSESDWRRTVQKIGKQISKYDEPLMEPVNFEKEEVEGSHLIRINTTAKLKNTESIMLILYGYNNQYARIPTDEELEKSLMLSFGGISNSILSARLSDLRKDCSIERKELKLKGKGLNKLKKKFLI